ncbi:M57 family metalloprotease [Cytophagales bacterium LB-30]|uniref:M57 family metalloprotease n=1 Tax=Shiella aurantiaca TaxID=3058365 RepID=A0ABT8F750_9BACT|nr:M57 family metalloprotease [Shiella aurantiaca]MDN4166031.1 M57 family metalloprotease [Shiella aurantiaca]
MKTRNYFLSMLLGATVLFASCDTQDEASRPADLVPDHVLSQLTNLGFDVNNFAPMKFEEGYLVEGDIYLTDADIATMTRGNAVPNQEQYRTTNLVSGPRVITVYAPQGGSTGYSPAMIAGLDEAISRYNAEGLSLTFQRVTSSSNADIVMTRLSKRDERRGVLGSAGFPTASGDPYGQIKMSGVLESSYGLSTDGIATIIAHEMGHCIGFRHTDYFDRSISCGGSTSNEGSSGVGAIHIPGTPTGASASAKSWMLACTDGSNRPFNNDDKTALNYLY